MAYDPSNSFGLIRSLFLLYRCKKKIIPNRELAFFFLVALAVNLQNPGILLFAPIIIAFSFSAYLIDLWGAGDGKLFICYSLYLFPFVEDGLSSALINLALAVSLCYLLFFWTVFLKATKKGIILACLKKANKRTFSLETLRKMSLSFALFAVVTFSLDLLNPLTFFGFFFFGFLSNFYLSLSEASGSDGTHIVFAPFLFASSLLVALILP